MRMPVNLNGDSFYSEQANVLFHCVPKVASRSILNLCAESFPDGYCVKEKGLTKAAFYEGLKHSPFSFVFIRHPIQRTVSFYFDKCVNYDGSEGKKQMFGRYRQLKPEMTIKEFIAWLGSDEGRDADADHHFCSQHLFTHSRNWKKCVDFIGYFNKLNEGISHVWTRLEREVPILPHLNANTDPERSKPVDTSTDYHKYLDTSDIRALYKRYEADFDLFDFDAGGANIGLRISQVLRTMKRKSGLANIPQR
jgi:Sulfotransferase family